MSSCSTDHARQRPVIERRPAEQGLKALDHLLAVPGVPGAVQELDLGDRAAGENTVNAALKDAVERKKRARALARPAARAGTGDLDVLLDKANCPKPDRVSRWAGSPTRRP
ncbi:hypothetical protein GCM10010377_64240 [Streptomyces viridiviolaceus]|uniref:Transposase n=1 Tax=Streptomyces viridiviolaceus TaxID=68282 RepID=A0ABW2E9P8_9ACTN|nr:hypothetical protein GCM10010377_64240 [Streptomyces viridiviolaceus]